MPSYLQNYKDMRLPMLSEKFLQKSPLKGVQVVQNSILEGTFSGFKNSEVKKVTIAIVFNQLDSLMRSTKYATTDDY